MNDRGLKQVDILEACKPYCEKYGVKLAKNDLSQYISGKVQPGQDKLTILGQALKVNEVWLMGYNVPQGIDELISYQENLSNDSKLQHQIQEQYGVKTLEVVNEFQKLDEIDQSKILERIDVLLEDEKYSIKKESKHA